MAIHQRWTAIGIFEEQAQAMQAIDELKQSGFSDDQIGFVFRDETPVVSTEEVEDEKNTGAEAPNKVAATDEQRVREEEATGAVTGGIVGGMLGAAVALLIPVLGPAFAGGILVTVFSAALGAVTGSFLGVFVAIGVPEEQARHYEQEFMAGRTIVTVKTEDHQQKALDILYQNGARYANTHDRE